MSIRIIGDTNIPFLSYRTIAISGSVVAILIGVAFQLLGPGLKLGIDFQGGIQVTLKFRDTPDLAQIRSVLSDLETGEPSLQRYGEAEKNEILIKGQNPGGAEGDLARPIIERLQAALNADLGQALDLNLRGVQELTDELAAGNPEGINGDVEILRAHYEPMARAVLDYRRTAGSGIFHSLDELDRIEGLSDAARAFLKGRAAVGAFALVGTDSVGPTVGKDLRRQAMMAIVFALFGMLIYIWIRFQLPYAIGAVVALIHDVLIALAGLAVTGREVNLPEIAALLTLVGYSVNDTVVIFDRVRENLKMQRGEQLDKVMDLSINQTLSRTIITSGTVLLTVVALYLFGGDVINTFAFVLLVGVIAGCYSTVFIASPVALWINALLGSRKARRRSKRRR